MTLIRTAEAEDLDDITEMVAHLGYRPERAVVVYRSLGYAEHSKRFFKDPP